jgi:hypothetical protein
MAAYSWGSGQSQQATPTPSPTPPPSPIDEYTPRARLAALIARCELDPEGIGAAVRADPVAAMQSAGFSEGQAQALTAAPAQADDPVAALAAGCNDTSCVISFCPPTCFVTIPAIPGICQPGGGGGGHGCSIFTLF